MATKLKNVVIFDNKDDPAYDPTRVVVWADAGLYEVIESLEGVAVMDYRSTYYEVLLDPRYNRDELLDDIIAAVTDATGNL